MRTMLLVLLVACLCGCSRIEPGQLRVGEKFDGHKYGCVLESMDGSGAVWSFKACSVWERYYVVTDGEGKIVKVTLR